MKNDEIKLPMAGMEYKDKYGNYLIPASFLVRITKDDVDTVVDAFMKSGGRGWCDSIKVVGRQFGVREYEQVSKGGEIALHDARMDRWEVLTKAKLIRGIQMYAEKPVYGDFFEMIDHVLCIDCVQIDDEAADAIIQYAIFARVLYKEGITQE